MKSNLSHLANALLLVALSAIANSATGGIASTKHNLGATQTSGNYMTAGTDEICVFCHTPHGANTNAAVPLWNKSFSSVSYSTYKNLGTSSLDAAELSVGSVSLACLSCHDGTQAMDSMINAPGSGGYNSNGAQISGGGWTGTKQSAGVLSGSPIPMLGTDLTNDHPIGIQYCGGWSGYASAPTSGWATTVCTDSDFKTPSSKLTASGYVWWVDTSSGTTGNREKTDMILYSRDFGTSGGVGPSVECASCHDVHVESKGTPENPQVAFMRISQSGSGICLACHVK